MGSVGSLGRVGVRVCVASVVGEGEGTAKWPPLSKELIYCTLTRHSAGKPDRFTIIPVDDRYRSEGEGGVVSYGTARRASGGALTLALAWNCKVTDKPC